MAIERTVVIGIDEFSVEGCEEDLGGSLAENFGGSALQEHESGALFGIEKHVAGSVALAPSVIRLKHIEIARLLKLFKLKDGGWREGERGEVEGEGGSFLAALVYTIAEVPAQFTVTSFFCWGGGEFGVFLLMLGT